MMPLEEALCALCAPTLMGEKVGSLFSCDFSDEAAMRRALFALNGHLRMGRLSVLPLRWRKNRALLYCVRLGDLMRALQNEQARQILWERGYGRFTLGACMAQLQRRLRENGDFPHEIGLFLDYPPQDVACFAKGDDACLLSGYWRVYHNPEKARETFRRYDLCTRHCASLRRRHGVGGRFFQQLFHEQAFQSCGEYGIIMLSKKKDEEHDPCSYKKPLRN